MNNNNLKEAFRELNHEKYDELMGYKKKHEFSNEFKNKCTQISTEPAAAPKKGTPSKLPIFLRKGKRGLVFITAVLAMFISVSGFCRVVYIGDFVFYIYPQHSDAYHVECEGKPETIEEIYYIPEEAGVTNAEVYDEWFPETETYGIIYEYEGEELIFDQFIIPGKHSINTEYYMPELTKIDDNNGYYLKMKHGCAIIFWANDDYCFQLLGKDDKETLVKIAEYVKPVENKQTETEQ